MDQDERWYWGEGLGDPEGLKGCVGAEGVTVQQVL